MGLCASGPEDVDQLGYSLYRAVETCDLDRVEEIIDTNKDSHPQWQQVIDWRRSAAFSGSKLDDGTTPLQLAVEHDTHPEAVDIVAALIKGGANVNVAQPENLSRIGLYNGPPLARAASRGNAEMCSMLLEAKADANAIINTQEAHTALFAAKNPEVVKVLLDGGARWDVHASEDFDFGRTAVHALAVHAGVHAETAELDGDTVDYTAALRVLLEHKADVDVRCKGDLGSQATPLMSAASHGAAEAAQLLLEYGASVNVVDERGRTPLHLAVRSECKDTALLVGHLLARGADITAKDNQGQTPLEIAKEDDVKQLLEQAKDGSESGLAQLQRDKARRGEVAELGKALWDLCGWLDNDTANKARAQAEKVKLLLQERSDIRTDAVNYRYPYGSSVIGMVTEGLTTLHMCAEHNQAYMAQVLLEAKADPMVVESSRRMNPLHVAAVKGATQVVRVLTKFMTKEQLEVTCKYKFEEQHALALATSRGRKGVRRVLQVALGLRTQEEVEAEEKADAERERADRATRAAGDDDGILGDILEFAYDEFVAP